MNIKSYHRKIGLFLTNKPIGFNPTYDVSKRLLLFIIIIIIIEMLLFRTLLKIASKVCFQTVKKFNVISFLFSV